MSAPGGGPVNGAVKPQPGLRLAFDQIEARLYTARVSTEQRVVVAMSGGVDSSVAAALLHRQGYEVIGITMTLSPHESQAAPAGRGCCSVWDVTDAEKVAWKLGIPHYSFNLREEFQRYVIDDFLQEYARGRTPHPCRRCNQHIKFDHLLRRAREMGAHKVVTGHYARIRYDEASQSYRLLRGLDPAKDQSYVLGALTQEQLSQTLFPLGELTKPEVRQLARELGLVSVAEKPESQDLCFIPDGDTAGFLKRNLSEGKSEAGEIVDARGNRLGEHAGLAYYTVGQRKGLGIATGKPRYVLELNVATNQVVVGDPEELLRSRMTVEEVNWIHKPVDRAHVKYRHQTPGADASLTTRSDGTVEVTFDSPQRALTPGQTAVFYADDEVLGGGSIGEIL